ncbi:MAG: CopD family protein [Sulfuriferula sp.]
MIMAKFLHVLGAVIWVGGMFFAYMALRPVAAERLEPPQRLNLWEGVFSRFFPWVWLAVTLILGSGLYMMAILGKPPVYVMMMFGLGVLMMLLFAHIYFAPFKRLKRAVAAQDWAAGGIALAQIRKSVGINLLLGLITVTVATLGVYLG